VCSRNRPRIAPSARHPIGLLWNQPHLREGGPTYWAALCRGPDHKCRRQLQLSGNLSRRLAADTWALRTGYGVVEKNSTPIPGVPRCRMLLPAIPVVVQPTYRPPPRPPPITPRTLFEQGQLRIARECLTSAETKGEDGLDEKPLPTGQPKATGCTMPAALGLKMGISSVQSSAATLAPASAP
jgi:hypothetical protein